MPQSKRHIQSTFDSFLKKRFQYVFGLILLALIVLGITFQQAKSALQNTIYAELSTAAKSISFELNRRSPINIENVQRIFNSEPILAALASGDQNTIKQALPRGLFLDDNFIKLAIYNTDGETVYIHQTNQPHSDSFEKSLLMRSTLIAHGHTLLDVDHKVNGRSTLYAAHHLLNYQNKNVGSLMMAFNITKSVKLVGNGLPENSPFGFLLLDRFTKEITAGGRYAAQARLLLNNENVLAFFPQAEDFYYNDGVWFRSSVAPYLLDDFSTEAVMPWELLIYVPQSLFNTRLLESILPTVLALFVSLLAVLFVLFNRFKSFDEHKENLIKVTSEPTEALNHVSSTAMWRAELGEQMSLIGTSLYSSLGYERSEINPNDIDNLLALVSPDDVSNVKRTVLQLLQNTIDEIDIDIKVRHKLGYWVWQNYRCAVTQRDTNGDPKEIVGVTLDITKRKQDEKILLSDMREAKRSNQLKTDFIANISHDVRTPINSILGYNQLLRLMDLNPNQEEFIDKIKESTLLLLNRFNQILIYSKLESNEFELDLRPSELEALVNSALDDMKELQEKILEVNVHIDSSLVNLYLLDREHLKLAIELLLNCAVNLSENQHVTLSINNTGRSKKTHNVIFRIEVKYDDNYEKDIIEAINRLNVEKSSGEQFVNLDIELAYKLLEKMNADLTLTTEDSNIFVLSFNIALDIPDVYHRLKAKEETELPKTSGPSLVKLDDSPVSSLEQFKNIHLLLVDDNATNREVIIQILRNLNVQTDIASNGLEAVNKIKENNFDMVLMDIQMPVMDGLEATQKVRNELNNQTLPIVAVTANQFVTDRDKALAAGMNDFIPKPVSAKILNDCIEKWVFGADIDISVALPDQQGGNKSKHASSKTLPVINAEASIARLGNDKMMLIRIYQRFESDFVNWVKELDALIADKALSKAKLHAHTLKGAAGNIDARALSLQAAELEKLFATNDIDEAQVSTLVKDIETNLDKVYTNIRKYLSENTPEPLSKDQPGIVEVDLDGLIQEFVQILDKHKRIPMDKLTLFKDAATGRIDETDVEAFIEKCNAFDFTSANTILKDMSNQHTINS